MDMAERIAKVEVEVKNLKERNTDEHAELKKVITDFIESAPSKFASKNVEKVLYATIGIILSGVLMKVMDLI